MSGTKHPVVRLGALMFFQLFIFGGFNPILSLYLTRDLGFSSMATGLLMALSVMSSIVAPLLSVFVIDRRIAARQLFILSHLVLVASALGLFFVRDLGAFLAFYLLNALFAGPTMGILNALTFQTLADRDGSGSKFGSIRVWGTLGWMLAGYVLSLLGYLLPKAWGIGPDQSVQYFAFLMAALGSVVCIILALGLPAGHVNPAAARGRLINPDALAILRRGPVLALSLVYLLSSILDKLFFFGNGPYLQQLGYSTTLIPSLMTLGQLSEIVMLFFLGRLLGRFGYKKVLVFGALAQVLRFVLYQIGGAIPALVAVSLNGLVFACLYSVVVMYIDRHSPASARQGLHQLIGLFIGGSSALLGNVAAGVLGQIFQTGDAINFNAFWAFATGGSVLGLAVLFFLFREEPEVRV